MDYKTKSKFQLVQLDNMGNPHPFVDRPGVPLDLFATKKEATAWAQEHPEKFTVSPKTYTVLPVSVLEPIEEKNNG